MNRHTPTWRSRSWALALTSTLLAVTLFSLLGPKSVEALPTAPHGAAASSDMGGCEGVITLDELNWHLTCLNWSCAQNCRARRLPFVHPLTGEQTSGMTCTCEGVASPCCKLFIREHQGEPEIYGVGECSNQNLSCPLGDWCGSLWRALPGGTEITAECYPFIPW